MFIRIAWKQSSRAHPVRSPLRPGALPNRRTSDDLDIPPRDFHRMTRGLFDRAD